MDIVNSLHCLKNSLKYYQKNRFNLVAIKTILGCLGEIHSNKVLLGNYDIKFKSISINQELKDRICHSEFFYIAMEHPMICKKKVVFDEKIAPFNLAKGNEHLSIISFPKYVFDEIHFNELLLVDGNVNLDASTYFSNINIEEMCARKWYDSGVLFMLGPERVISPRQFIKYVLKKYESHNDFDDLESEIDEMSRKLIVGEMIFDAYMIEYISHLLTIKFDAKEDLAVYSTKFVRYLDYEYCKQFYDDGRLRLTNIRVFRSYDNEYQGDLNEGIYTKNSIFLGKYRMKAIAEYGGNAYILCGTINDTKALRAVFKASSGVEIRNLPAFADDILSSNPEIQLLVADKCKYNDEDPFIENMVKRGVKIGKNGHLLFSQKIVEEEIGKHFSIMDLFMKHSNYKYQQEYRFIVNLPGDEDFALIKTSKQKHYSRMVSF